ncbi:hypothetical protein MKZ38_002768 [Zalerion maritima]|uniref:F-box domain-containing protein n=1 Tax=Zalerion maritima TaxID=339359 RepID=A0AAD5WS77_9PEZI|nr:hypothetical protein MKZ38_002768 [Zalerion maritima]
MTSPPGEPAPPLRQPQRKEMVINSSSTERNPVYIPSKNDHDHEPKKRDNHVSPSSKESCDRRRAEDEHSQLSHVPTQLVGKTVTPFLREHIPGLYAPIGKSTAASLSKSKDPNSKFCYRHQPDARCRRAADEVKMESIQRELDELPQDDRQAIAHVWSLFSAAPSKHRDLMLKGIITQCCFPQLSTVSREVQEQLKIDFITALPQELSYQILGLLDTTSLCKAAQVSRRWRVLADDDVVWHRMCEQHIDKKCKKCGWGLPLLDRQRLSEFSKEAQSHVDSAHGPPSPPDSQTASKRSASIDADNSRAKRQCISRVSGEIMTHKTKAQLEEERKFKPWKVVYRDRYKIGYNWKHGLCSVKTFSGHENGVTCLQFNDKYLATGSYDATIKIWDIESGELLRTLEGHQTGIRALWFDDTRLVSGSLDHTIKTWNWKTGVLNATFQAHTDGVISVHFEGDYLVSGSIDHTVRIFQFSTRMTWVLRGHSDWVNHVRVDSSAQVVYSGSDDCTVKMWDLASLKCIKTFAGHVGQVQQLLPMPADFEPELDNPADGADSASVASGRGGTPNGSQELGGRPIDRTAYGETFDNPDRPLPARYIMTAALDNTMRLWDTATGQCIRTFFGHLEGIWGLAADTLRAVTGANDNMVKVWCPRTGKCERTFTGHTGPVTCVGLSDSRMASGSEDGDVRLYSFDGDWGLEEAGTPF